MAWHGIEFIKLNYQSVGNFDHLRVNLQELWDGPEKQIDVSGRAVMFSVEFTIGRRSRSKSVALSAQIEGFSRFETCDRGGDAIAMQVGVEQRSGRGRWARLMAMLGIAPSASLQPDRS